MNDIKVGDGILVLDVVNSIYVYVLEPFIRIPMVKEDYDVMYFALPFDKTPKSVSPGWFSWEVTNFNGVKYNTNFKVMNYICIFWLTKWFC